jgi:hypothetical protein
LRLVAELLYHFQQQQFQQQMSKEQTIHHLLKMSLLVYLNYQELNL